MDKLILVFYIDVGNISPSEVAEYIEGIRDNTRVGDINEVVQFYIPVRDQETRVECINPKFVTDEDMIKKFEKQIKGVNSKCEQIMSAFPYFYKKRLLIEKI